MTCGCGEQHGVVDGVCTDCKVREAYRALEPGLPIPVAVAFACVGDDYVPLSIREAGGLAERVFRAGAGYEDAREVITLQRQVTALVAYVLALSTRD